MHIDNLIEACIGWKSKLEKIKSNPPPGNFSWYGHDILSNLWHLQSLLSEPNARLLDKVSDDFIADIGAADGDLSYFLFSLGYKVDIIDWPDTNWNRLQGAHVLGEILQSPVEIHKIDLDSQFQLPREYYGLVLFLGILYHLKNPYYALEHLAKHCRYCYISTRITRHFQQGQADISKLPVAYLLDPKECNNDSTNYWIFSLAGLKRLVYRAGWDILESMTVGDTQQSDPRSPEHDERAFMLLESRQQNQR